MKTLSRIIIWTVFFALVTGVISQLVYADDVFVVVMRKQEEKRSKSWSLSDWLLTKKKMALMDQWLALHSSADIFEFFLSGAKSNYKFHTNDTSNNRRAFNGRFGAYLSIFGVEGEYERSDEKHESYSGLLAFRFFGTSNQTTNLTLHAGMRGMQLLGQNEQHYNYFYGARANLNIFGFIGLEGLYRRYLTQDYNGISSYGNLIEYGAFLDIFFIRFFGTLFREKQYLDHPESSRMDYRRGTKLGITLFM